MSSFESCAASTQCCEDPGAAFATSSASAAKSRAAPAIPNANIEAVPRINFADHGYLPCSRCQRNRLAIHSRWVSVHSRPSSIPSDRRVKFGAVGAGLRASPALPVTRVVEFVAANRLPAIYVWRWFFDSRPSSYELWRRALTSTTFSGGAKPADLSVEQPTRSN